MDKNLIVATLAIVIIVVSGIVGIALSNNNKRIDSECEELGRSYTQKYVLVCHTKEEWNAE